MKIFLHIFLFLFIFTHTLKAQWIQTSGPEAGAITSYTSGSNYLFTGTFGAGAFRSNDNGITWSAITSGLGSAYVQDLAYNNGHLLAATSNGVYLSLDNGNSWTLKNNGLTATGISKIISQGNYTFIGILNTVYVSTDFGDNWSLTNFTANPTEYITGMFFKGNYLFCSSSASGVKRSADHGVNWTTVNSGLPGTSTRGMGTDGNGIFISNYGDGIFKSMDDGLTWTEVGSGLSSSTTLYSFAFIGNTIIAGGNIGVGRSTDYGDTWVESNDSMTRAVQAVYRDGNRLFAGNYTHDVFYNYRGGNYYSNDTGVTWIRANTGIINSNIIEMKIDQDLIVAGGDGGIFISNDHGNHWNEVSYSNENFRKNAGQSIDIKDSIIFVGTIRNKLFRSKDRGNSWTYSGNGMSGDNVSSVRIMENQIFATTQNGVNRSNDTGLTWASVNMGLTGLTCNALWNLGDTIFVGTSAGVYSSTDSGTTWNSVPGITSAVYVFESIGSHLFAGTATGVYHSDDNGNSWNQISSTFTSKLSTWNHVLFTGSGTFTPDNGTTWMSVPALYPPFILAPSVVQVAIDSNYFYYGVLNLGVWRLSTTGLIGVEELQSENELKIYPNPSNGLIHFGMNHSIEEYQIVNTNNVIVKYEKLNAPIDNVEINTPTPGLYILRVKSNKRWASRKFMVIN